MKKNENQTAKERLSALEIFSGIARIVFLLLIVAAIEAFALALVFGMVALYAEGLNIWGGAEGVRDAIRFFGQNHRAAFITLIAVGYLVTLFYVAWKTVNLITKQ